MFRVKLHRLNGGAVRARCGKYQKHFIATNIHKLVLYLKEVYRDLLYDRYGITYRFQEAHHRKDIERSMISAIRRMQ